MRNQNVLCTLHEKTKKSHLAWELKSLTFNKSNPQRSPKTPKDPQRPPKTQKIPKDGHPETSREALEMFFKLCLTNRSRSCNGLPLCFVLYCIALLYCFVVLFCYIVLLHYFVVIFCSFFMPIIKSPGNFVTMQPLGHA